MEAQKVGTADTAQIIRMINDPNTSDNVRLSSLLDLAVFFRSIDVLDCYRYSNEAYLLADAIGDSISKGTACRLMGISYILQGNNAEAARWTIRSYELAQKYGTEENVLSSVINLGGIYYKLEEFDQSLVYSRRALAIGTEKDNSRIIAASSEAIALVFLELYQTDSAEVYFRRAMDIYKATGKEKELANCISSFAGVFEKRNDYQGALKQIREANSIYQRLDEGYLSNEFLSFQLGRQTF